MNKKEWMIVILPLLAVWIFDHITKVWASQMYSIKDFGLVMFALHHNPGAMLGLFSELPAVLRIVSLSTGGALLVCIYGFIQYLLPIKSLIMRTGLSLLLSGIIGNVTDRIVWGHVIDFIVFQIGSFRSPAFNIADAIQWVGYFFISYTIIKEGQILWPENNMRKKYWINPKFQMKYSFLLLGVGLGISLISSVFSYTYLKVTIIELTGNNPLILSKFLAPFAVTYVVIALGTSLGLFTVGKIISHKIAGPIYAFEKYVNEVINHKNNSTPLRKFQLRSQDEFKNLENVAKKLKESFIPEVPLDPSPDPEELESA